MSGSRHLRVRLQTSASPEQVFAVMRGLTSARRESVRSFAPIDVPTVSTRPPRFSIRAPVGGRGDAPVAWAGEVTEAPPAGSLIVARTNRSTALWQAGIGVVACLATIVWFGSTGQSTAWSLFVLSVFMSIFATMGWTRATRLRERDKRNARVLLDVLIERLPDASLIEGPV